MILVTKNGSYFVSFLPLSFNVILLLSRFIFVRDMLTDCNYGIDRE